MKNPIGHGLGLAVVALGVGVGCEGRSHGLNPDGGIDQGAICEGMCIGKLLLPTPAFIDMSIDRDRQRLYGSGVRIDVSNPRAMKATPLPKRGPIVVDPSTGRYATSEFPGTGDNTRTLFIFNSDDTLYDSQPLPGMPLAMDVDAANGLFFVTTQQVDQIVVYREASREVLASRSVSALSAWPIFDPTTGNVFLNLAVGPQAIYQWQVLDRKYDLGPPSDGHILFVDGVRKLVYLGVGDHFPRLEIRESMTWALATTQVDTDAYWVAPDPALNRLYVRRLYDLAVFDQTSGDYLASLPMSDGFTLANMAFAPGDDRIYVAGFEPIATPYSAEPILLVFATR
jgi:hypothetical protein